MIVVLRENACSKFNLREISKVPPVVHGLRFYNREELYILVEMSYGTFLAVIDLAAATSEPLVKRWRRVDTIPHGEGMMLDISPQRRTACVVGALGRGYTVFLLDDDEDSEKDEEEDHVDGTNFDGQSDVGSSGTGEHVKSHASTMDDC